MRASLLKIREIGRKLQNGYSNITSRNEYRNGKLHRSTIPRDRLLVNTRQRSIVVSRFDFTGYGMDVPYNTQRAAKAQRAEKET